MAQVSISWSEFQETLASLVGSGSALGFQSFAAGNLSAFSSNHDITGDCSQDEDFCECCVFWVANDRIKFCLCEKVCVRGSRK